MNKTKEKTISFIITKIHSFQKNREIDPFSNCLFFQRIIKGLEVKSEFINGFIVIEKKNKFVCRAHSWILCDDKIIELSHDVYNKEAIYLSSIASLIEYVKENYNEVIEKRVLKNIIEDISTKEKNKNAKYSTRDAFLDLIEQFT